MDISHIVINGCSFAYGSGLTDPRNQAWAGIIGKYFNIPVVNLARPSTGNDAIFRRTYEYFYEDYKNNNKPFYIICLSAITREEYWLNEEKKYEGVHVHGIDYKDMASIQKNYVENFNIENSYRRTLLYYMGLKNLFDAHNIPYAMFTLMHLGTEQIEIEKQLQIKLPNFIKAMDEDKNNLHSQNNILGTNYRLLDCGHYDADTNKTIADHIIANINLKHDIKKIEENFLSLANFTKVVEPHYHPINWQSWQSRYGAWM